MRKKITYLIFWLLILGAVVFTLTSFTQSDYQTGWENGYKEGYCYKTENCIEPIVPIAPVPEIGRDSFKDGEYDGFIRGRGDKRSR